MDLKLVENGNGGDFVKKTRDLQVIEGLGNMPYLALFGGMIRQSTPTERLESEQAFDWWGNTLLMGQNQDQQFNSETERALIETPLTSAGRILIEQAVKNDLKFMRDFANVSVSVSIPKTDYVIIGILLEEPDNIQNREFAYIWDASRGELDELEVKDRIVSTGGLFGLDFQLDYILI